MSWWEKKTDSKHVPVARPATPAPSAPPVERHMPEPMVRNPMLYFVDDNIIGYNSAAQAHAVVASFVYVQIKTYSGFPKGLGKLQAVLHRDGFVLPGMPNETGWRVGGDAQLV